jgi:hypothetical protein
MKTHLALLTAMFYLFQAYCSHGTGGDPRAAAPPSGLHFAHGVSTPYAFSMSVRKLLFRRVL